MYILVVSHKRRELSPWALSGSELKYPHLWDNGNTTCPESPLASYENLQVNGKDP